VSLREVRRTWQRTFPGRCAGTFLELQGIDRAMALAAQAFTALIPLLLLASAWVSVDGGNAVADAVIRRFHLTGGGADAVNALFARQGDGTVGALSVVLLVFSGVSLTRRLQRMYQQAWRIPPLTGVRGSFSAAFGLAALVLEIALMYSLRTVFRHLPLHAVTGWPLTLLASLALWTAVPWLLLDRRIAWRRLVPSGALAAVGVAVYSLATTVYMPALLESYSLRYGIFGVTLALVSWLLCISLIIVATTIVAAEFDRSDERWARRLRARLHVGADGPPNRGG
jgi:membrane protein